MARPPTPISVKRLKGDTRQRGANKFQDSLTGTWEPKRGRPKFPAGLLFRHSAAPPSESDAVAAQRKERDEVQRKRLVLARTHWKYVADQLEAEGKLSLVDEGVLTGLALSYALMIEAGRDGDVRAYKEVSQRYMQAADRMGLNESARVRIPGKGKDSTDPIMADMCG